MPARRIPPISSRSPESSGPPEPGRHNRTHLWVVDQCDNQWVTVEVDGDHSERLPRWLFPRIVAEGDVFRVQQEIDNAETTLTIVADPTEQQRRLQHSQRQIEQAKAMQQERGNDEAGDIVL